MEILAGVWFLSALIYVGTVVARPILVKRRMKRYEDGLETRFQTLDGVMECIKKTNCPAIKQVHYNEKGIIEVIGKKAKHIVTLENGKIYASYNAFSEKKTYKAAVEHNAILDYIAKEENHNLPINPYSIYKRGRRFSRLHGVTCFLTVVLFVMIGIGTLTETDSMEESSPYVSMVKYGSPEVYPDITYEDAFNAFFGNPKWKYFKSDENQDVVEFHGKCIYQDAEVDATIQFVVDEESETFTMEYLGLNKISQNKLVMSSLIEKVFTEYENSEE